MGPPQPNERLRPAYLQRAMREASTEDSSRRVESPSAARAPEPTSSSSQPAHLRSSLLANDESLALMMSYSPVVGSTTNGVSQHSKPKSSSLSMNPRSARSTQHQLSTQTERHIASRRVESSSAPQRYQSFSRSEAPESTGSSSRPAHLRPSLLANDESLALMMSYSPVVDGSTASGESQHFQPISSSLSMNPRSARSTQHQLSTQTERDIALRRVESSSAPQRYQSFSRSEAPESTGSSSRPAHLRPSLLANDESLAFLMSYSPVVVPTTRGESQHSQPRPSSLSMNPRSARSTQYQFSMQTERAITPSQPHDYARAISFANDMGVSSAMLSPQSIMRIANSLSVSSEHRANIPRQESLPPSYASAIADNPPTYESATSS